MVPQEIPRRPQQNQLPHSGAKLVLAPSCVSLRDRQRRVCRRPTANGHPRMADLDGMFQEATSGLTGLTGLTGDQKRRAGRAAHLFPLIVSETHCMRDWRRAKSARNLGVELLEDENCCPHPAKVAGLDASAALRCCLCDTFTGHPPAWQALRNIKHGG